MEYEDLALSDYAFRARRYDMMSPHDSAVRSYYAYAHLRKLLRIQEKTLLDELSSPLQIAASVIGIFAFIQGLAPKEMVIPVYVIAMAVASFWRLESPPYVSNPIP
jgi:hypothetical protein